LSAPKFSTFFEKLKSTGEEKIVTNDESLGEESIAENTLDNLDFETVEETPSGSTPPPLPHEIFEIPAPTYPSHLREDAKFWSELSTRLWRADRQLRRLNTEINHGESSAGMERLTRRFEEILETLQANDIEILDHTGEKYDAGLSLNVLQFEPQSGISSEMILETVKPSVRLGKLLVPGEVIVATPIASTPIATPEEQIGGDEAKTDQTETDV